MDLSTITMSFRFSRLHRSLPIGSPVAMLRSSILSRHGSLVEKLLGVLEHLESAGGQILAGAVDVEGQHAHA